MMRMIIKLLVVLSILVALFRDVSCLKDEEWKSRIGEFPSAFVVGSLMYAMTCTRPDIAYAISLTSGLTSNPGLEHWNASLRIMKSLAH